MLRGLEGAGACSIVREHANHPRLVQQGEWQDRGRTETGAVREQTITVAEAPVLCSTCHKREKPSLVRLLASGSECLV